MNKLKTFIREPIVLFFLLGILLYITYSITTDYFLNKSREIIVKPTEVTVLEESFRKTWNRNPTQEELENLIRNWVMDEIFFREAVAMGLDRTDPVVKRRLRQIMEIMLDDLATIYPTENQLRQYLSENPEKFRRSARLSFRHLYFPLDDQEKARQFLTGLQNGASKPEDHSGGLFMIPSSFKDEGQYEIERLFGIEFSQAVFQLEVGGWTGPVASAYGWHLMEVTQLVPGEVPDLNEIWDEVEREWSVERKREIKEEQYKVLRDHYNIILADQKSN